MAAEVFARHDALLAEEAMLGASMRQLVPRPTRERALAELNRARTALANEAFACEQRRIKLVASTGSTATILSHSYGCEGALKGRSTVRAKLDTAELNGPLSNLCAASRAAARSPS